MFLRRILWLVTLFLIIMPVWANNQNQTNAPMPSPQDSQNIANRENSWGKEGYQRRENYQDQTALRTQAAAYVVQALQAAGNSKVSVEISKLDSRLKLPPCTLPLQFSMVTQTIPGALRTIGASCPKPVWQVYLQAKIYLQAKLVVATHNLARGTQLTAADIKLQEMNTLNVHQSYYTDAAQIVGKILKRDIQANMIITPQSVENKAIILRGDTVSIITDIRGIHVEVKGIAKEAGAVEDHIQVTNASSKKVIEAIVVDRGKVRVP